MFVNVINMKNQFIEYPNENSIKKIEEYFCLHDAVIAIDSSDVKEIMDDAENTIVLSGKATGYNRCGDAIEDAVLHTCSVACDYDLFTANKVIIFVLCPKDAPMLMSENESINTIAQMFHQNNICKWGLAEKEHIHYMHIMIIASNLQKKS